MMKKKKMMIGGGKTKKMMRGGGKAKKMMAGGWSVKFVVKWQSVEKTLPR